MDGYNYLDKFTTNAKKVLTNAQKVAREMGSAHLGTEHLLLAMLNVRSGSAYEILSSFGVSTEKADMVVSLSRSEGEGKVGLTAGAKRLIESAVLLAAQHGSYYIGTEHLLLSMMQDKNSEAVRIMKELSAPVIEITQAALDSVIASAQEKVGASGGSVDKSKSKDKSTTPILDTFSVNLTAMAREGKIDPIVGRDAEIQRMIQILNRRTKNNPVLIGEPGIGKTAIVEGLAMRIVEKQVPENLANKRIMVLSPSMMVAGTKYRGEFEERINQVIDEVRAAKDVILFIDELHTLVGAGSAEGSLDAANILKPALARGDFQLIGASTIDEYRKHIEKDAALERRFQSIMVKEPSPKETVGIMMGIKEKYEEHHRVLIPAETIEAAVSLSVRYINDRYLPDKAIDLIDEAASAVRIAAGMFHPEVAEERTQLEKLIAEKEQAIEKQDYEKAAKIRAQELKLQKRIEATQKEQVDANDKSKWPTVGVSDIAKVVSLWTNIPVGNLASDEVKSLTDLEKALRTRIIGQEEAIEAVASAIRRSRVQIGNPDRPMGSFLFLGPTGVGKTELAKALAEEVFKDKDALVRIDMSEFMEKHNVSRLVGAPAGYVGYEEGGKLTEAIRRKPYAVVLLDEIEKAHPDVMNILLQMLEDGFLTDAKGKKVSFKNTVIIITSNIGTGLFNKQAAIGFKETGEATEGEYDALKNKVMEELKKSFRPELLNRIDKVIVFHPLTKTDVKQIVDLQLSQLSNRLSKQGINLEVSNLAREWITDHGFDPENGARPVRRVIQNFIEDELAEGILRKEFSGGSLVKIDKKGTKLVVATKVPEKSAKR